MPQRLLRKQRATACIRNGCTHAGVDKHVYNHSLRHNRSGPSKRLAAGAMVVVAVTKMVQPCPGQPRTASAQRVLRFSLARPHALDYVPITAQGLLAPMHGAAHSGSGHTTSLTPPGAVTVTTRREPLNATAAGVQQGVAWRVAAPKTTLPHVQSRVCVPYRLRSGGLERQRMEAWLRRMFQLRSAALRLHHHRVPAVCPSPPLPPHALVCTWDQTPHLVAFAALVVVLYRCQHWRSTAASGET